MQRKLLSVKRSPYEEICIQAIMSSGVDVSDASSKMSTTYEHMQGQYLLVNAETHRLYQSDVNKARFVLSVAQIFEAANYMLNGDHPHFENRPTKLLEKAVTYLALAVWAYYEKVNFYAGESPHTFAMIKGQNIAIIPDSIRSYHSSYGVSDLRQVIRGNNLDGIYVSLTHTQAGQTECKEFSKAAINLHRFMTDHPELITYDGKPYDELSEVDQAKCFLLVQSLFTQSRSRIQRPCYTIVYGDNTPSGEHLLDKSLLKLKGSPLWPSDFLATKEDDYTYEEAAAIQFKPSEAAAARQRSNATQLASELYTFIESHPDVIEYKGRPYNELNFNEQTAIHGLLLSVFNNSPCPPIIDKGTLVFKGHDEWPKHFLPDEGRFSYAETVDHQAENQKENHSYCCFL